MKILMVNKFLYPRGGSESYMLSLASELERLGHEVEYFGMYDEKNTVFNSSSQYTENMDFHSTGIKRFLYPFKIIYSLEALHKIMKVIDDFSPDIVHMNNINFQLTPSIIYGASKKGVAIVQTVHDYQMICPNHLFYNFEKNHPCEKCAGGSYIHCIKNKCIHSSLVKSVIGALEAFIYSILAPYKKVDLFICPSRFLEGKLLSARDYYKGKTLTVHNFIDKTRFKKSNGDTLPYIAFVGRLSKEKGIENIREVARLLPEYKFVIAGGGPDEELLRGIDNVTLTGFLEGEALTSLIGRARVLLLPSVCYENCPLSILEAHAIGTPVVTMNSGGMAELVLDKVTGALVDTPTPSEIASRIKELFEDDELYQSIRENVEKKREEILSASEYAEIIVKEYERLIARKK